MMTNDTNYRIRKTEKSSGGEVAGIAIWYIYKS